MAGGEDNLLEYLNSLVSSEKYREASVIVDAVLTVNKELFSEIKNKIYLNLSEQETSLMAKGIYKFDLDSWLKVMNYAGNNTPNLCFTFSI